MDCLGVYFNLTPECKKCKDLERCGKKWIEREMEKAFKIEDYHQ